MQLLTSKNTLGATLLVTGCCIGAGMIGLPVISALAGFMPSTLAMIFCYLFTTASGLLLLEATLWFDGKVNLPSIVESTLGLFGKAVTLSLFLLLFYCLFVAYMDGGGALFTDILSSLLQRPIPRQLGVISCALFVALITYAGAKVVDRFNRVLLFGLVASYFILVSVGLPNVSSSNLAFTDWTASLATIPILLICFGYQNLVPSLTYYLQKNVRAIRYAIIIGNLIPFFIYLLWNFVILGMLNAPHSPTVKEADLVTELLQTTMTSVSVIFFIKAFSIFAMLTSFIPNAMSFIDFLKDGFKKTFHHEQRNELGLYLLVFLPPLICTLIYPHLFLQALSFAGGFIDVLLYGIIPALVVLIGRAKKMTGPYQVIGRSITPICILILSFYILIIKLIL